MSDPVNSPAHYNAHPDGMECIELVERMTFCAGNAVKYLWRAGLKGSRVEDLKKARWYVVRVWESDHAAGEDGELRDDNELIDRACLGFPPIYASAIAHIVNFDYALALHCIDALISEADCEPKQPEKERAF